MTGRPPRHGLGDPRIPWVVLLDLTVPVPADLSVRLDSLYDDAGWTGPAPSPLEGARHELLGRLAADGSRELAVGTHSTGLVLAARHDALDGLGMLTAAAHLVAGPLASGARGLPADRSGGRGELVRRAWEVGVRPSARVAPATAAPAPGDVFARTVVAGSPRTAHLVHAGARAVSAWNRAHGKRSTRISVAVGASRVGGASAALADQSAFLRLRDVERLDLDGVRAALASAPVQTGGGGGSPLAGIASAALRLAAPRLGSTLLVSHLGEVDTGGRDLAPAFYPVTGGGSGLSLGAATVAGRTVLTLRARARTHDDDGLQHLLETVVDELG